MNTRDETASDSTPRAWPAYRTLWRWHFYAGLFCIPFVVMLSISGAIYLFKPQVEAALDRPYERLVLDGPAKSAAAQVAAAVAAVPGSMLNSYQLPATPHSAVQVLVGRGRELTRVYVHPQSLQILRLQPEDTRPMAVIRRLHGTLLAGDRGSNLVELAASWAIVMLATGLVLWWPRNASGLAGVIYPRLRGSRRVFWRDLHGVTGFWVSFMALFLLLSGLPWAASWGGLLKDVRQFNAAKPVQQDWTTGRAAELAQRERSNTPAADMSEHAEHRGRRSGDGMAVVTDYTAIDRMVATVRPLALAAPVLISPPSRRSAQWTARSEAQNRPLRVDVVLDPATGAILSRKDFADRPLLDRITSYGIAVHEGQLFGPLNQLLGLLTATGMLLLSISSVVLWWRRRSPGELGAPQRLGTPVRPAVTLVLLILMLAVLLPFLGLSLLVVLVVERMVLRQIPAAREFLGLTAG